MTKRTEDYSVSHLCGGLDFSTMRHANHNRNETKFTGCREWTLGDWGNAMAGEVGEACNKIKKLRRGDDISHRAIADELADVVLYADLLADKLGISLGAAVARKFNEVSRRVGSHIRLSHNSPE